MDTVDETTRSKIMRSVRQKDTRPEMRIRKVLHRLGFRYRLHDKRLPGSPDLVFPKYKAVIFVHGCFWHRHGCHLTTTPKIRVAFWTEKFKANVVRDKKNVEELIERGWRVLIIWECALKGKTKLDWPVVEVQITKWLVSDRKFVEISLEQGSTDHFC